MKSTNQWARHHINHAIANRMPHATYHKHSMQGFIHVHPYIACPSKKKREKHHNAQECQEKDQDILSISNEHIMHLKSSLYS